MAQNTESKVLASQRLTMLFVYRLNFTKATALQARSLKDGQSHSQTGTVPRLPEGSSMLAPRAAVPTELPALSPCLCTAAARLLGVYLPMGGIHALRLGPVHHRTYGSWTERGFIRQGGRRMTNCRAGALLKDICLYRALFGSIKAS